MPSATGALGRRERNKQAKLQRITAAASELFAAHGVDEVTTQQIADAADIGWYGGTMLETSLGSAASAHVFATLSDRHHGCELFGPQLLVDDIVGQPMEVRDFELQLPDGPGFGVDVDAKRLDRYDRARQGLAPKTVDFGRTHAQSGN
jgi:L-alanine-DL-glutamate epimerase-like enolase superfamily enzyme